MYWEKKATSEFFSLDLLSCSHLSYIHISFMPILNTSIIYFFMLNIFYRKNLILLFILLFIYFSSHFWIKAIFETCCHNRDQKTETSDEDFLFCENEFCFFFLITQIKWKSSVLCVFSYLEVWSVTFFFSYLCDDD